MGKKSRGVLRRPPNQREELVRVKRGNPVAKAVSTGNYPPKIINPEVIYKRNPKHKGESDD